MKNKVWFITGASQGLGLVLTKELLAKGHQVIATSRNADKITSEIGDNENLLALTVDLKKTSDIAKAAEAGVEKFGSIDILLNNAGYGQMWSFEETSEEEVKINIEENLFATLNATRAILPIMRKQKHGHIFVTGSAWGYGTVPYNSIYAAVKFALDGWSESISHELAPLNITISTIKPGGFRTNFFKPTSLVTGESKIADYAQHRDEWVNMVKSWDTHQDGNPKKYADFIIGLTNSDKKIPQHVFAGRDSYQLAKEKIQRVNDDLVALESLATNLHFEN